MAEVKREPLQLIAGERAPSDVAAFDEHHTIGDILRYAINQANGKDEVVAILATMNKE